MSNSKPVQVSLVAVGAELLSADRLETNCHEIQGLLLDWGVQVVRAAVVDDDLEAIAAEIRTAAGQADFVITTGGLGPTEDDVTREGAAGAAGVELKEHKKALAGIEEYFNRLGREMTASNRRQALIPKGAEVLPNLAGTAPAFKVSVEGTPVFCLPGPPVEMRKLMNEAVIPRILDAAGDGTSEWIRGKVHIVGLTESAVNDRIEDLLQAPDPRAGITVSQGVITITLSSSGPDAAERVTEAKEYLRNTFGDRILSEDGSNRIEDVVGKLLIERGITFSLAESCTGGLVGHLLTEVPGISDVFLEGVVVYSGEAKERALGIPKHILKQHGEVSEETAEAMAQGAAIRSGARATLAITGIAGPGGGTPEKPVGLVYMATFFDGKVRTKEYRLGGQRTQIKMRAAVLALELLRRTVLGLD